MCQGNISKYLFWIQILVEEIYVPTSTYITTSRNVIKIYKGCTKIYSRLYFQRNHLVAGHHTLQQVSLNFRFLRFCCPQNIFLTLSIITSALTAMSHLSLISAISVTSIVLYESWLISIVSTDNSYCSFCFYLKHCFVWSAFVSNLISGNSNWRQQN